MGSQPMTGMDDVERQAVHGDPEILEQRKKAKRECCSWWLCATLFAVVLCVAVPVMVLHRDVHYYVAVDSLSGLDPARGLSFNLTLGVSSWSFGAKACIKPGTYVDVSYGGVRLATSEAEAGRRLCAGPWEKAEQRVTAVASTGVDAGPALDKLAAELKRGVAVFDVRLRLPAGSYGRLGSYDGKSCVSECGGMRVGAAAAWCDAPNQSPKGSVGYRGVRPRPSGRFFTDITHDTVRWWLGTFDTVDLAARAYKTITWRFGHCRADMNFPHMQSLEEVEFLVPLFELVDVNACRRCHVECMQRATHVIDEAKMAQLRRNHPEFVRYELNFFAARENKKSNNAV